MMKIKVKFKTITYRGENKTITRTIEVPDFEPITTKLVITGIPEIDQEPISVDSQIMDWLDEWDKSEFMIENDIGSIINYCLVPSKKSKALVGVEDQRDAFYVYLDMYKDQASEQVINDYILTYERMKDLIKNFHPNKQMNIVTEAVRLAYNAQTAAYKSLSDLYNKKIPSVRDYYAARDRNGLSYKEWAKQKLDNSKQTKYLIDENLSNTSDR